MRMCREKIPEWGADSHGAQKNAIYLNDKYNLNRIDPTGIKELHGRPALFAATSGKKEKYLAK
jgi:hypothetical protein